MKHIHTSTFCYHCKYQDHNLLLLQVLYIPEAHTAETIMDMILSCLKEWGLKKENMVAMTTDNASANVKAATLMKAVRMQCFGHRLHLAVTHSLEDSSIKRVISESKYI